MSKKSAFVFFPRLLKCAVLEQPTVVNGGNIRGRSVAVAVGCWRLTLQWHFNGASMALQQNFNGTVVNGGNIRGRSVALAVGF